jgi:hypothetical protein
MTKIKSFFNQATKSTLDETTWRFRRLKLDKKQIAPEVLKPRGEFVVLNH